MPVELIATPPAVSAAATTASTALPPAARTALPASAPCGWPVTRPLPAGSAARPQPGRPPAANTAAARPRNCRRSGVTFHPSSVGLHLVSHGELPLPAGQVDAA